MKTEKVISTVFITMVIFVLCGSALGEPVFCAVGWFGEFAHIDPDIGVVTPIRNDLPSGLQALAWSPDGILYAGRENDIYKIDPRTGNYEHYLSITVDIRGMAISPSGVLYVTSEHTSSQAFGAINLETGAYTDIGLLWGDLTKAQGMAFSPNGVLYGIHPSRPSFKLFTIDLDDAETHLITDSLSTVGVNQSLSFTHEGALYAIGEEIFAQIDPTDGSVIEPIALSGCGECEFRGLALISNNNYDYYVNANGTGDYPTIQVAIDVASDGETVVAADGVYKGEGNRDIDFRGKAITVKSENGPENCVIDCETLGRGFYFQTNEGRDSILDGFTIINGRTDEMRYGGGIGAKNISSPTIRNCIVTECVAQNGGGGIASSGARIENCLILGNYAGWAGGGLWTDHSSVEIINCTVVDNKARDYGHGSCHWQDGHTSIINSIFWNEGNSEIYVRLSTISVSYSNVKNGFSGAGNIDADPCFVDASSGNYYLLADSLCIDTGDPNYIAEANETDLAGNPRILNDRIDMGTYEFVTTPAKPAPIYEVIDIGTGYVYALGINEKDEVVGHIKPNGSWSGSYAFYWNKESGLQSIGGRRARSINDLGQIAGQSASIQAGVWENGEWITLSNRQEAYAINNNGQVTGLISAQPSIPGPYAPFRDDNIYSPDFITLQRPYLRASHGFNINNKGQVVADCGTGMSGTLYVGVFYDSDESYTILDNGGNYDTHARGINDYSQIVGNSNTSRYVSNHIAVYWDSPDSVIEDMGRLGGGACFASAINNFGQAVGYSSERAFIWTKSGGMVDLNTTIDPNLNIVLTNALDISDKGSIAAQGVDSFGQQHSYLLTVVNNTPIADAGPNQIAYARIDGIAKVVLDGNDSYDPDGDQLTYSWSWIVDNNIYEANGVSPTIELPVGEYSIELIVNDGIDNSGPNYVIVKVIGPIDILIDLINGIEGMMLPHGIENSLIVKLDSALEKLEDDNEKNDEAAVNSLEAFINAVEAQRGKKISGEEADDLIEAVQLVIDILNSE